MNKRLRKKSENRFNVLKRAKRESSKRKGYNCIDYALVPIGSKDLQALTLEGFDYDYPYATHWFIQLAPSKVKYPVDSIYTNIRADYGISVFLCNQDGGTHTDSELYIHLLRDNTIENLQNVYDKHLHNMKHDRFWIDR